MQKSDSQTPACSVHTEQAPCAILHYKAYGEVNVSTQQ